MPDSIWIADIAGFFPNDVFALAYTLDPFGLTTYHILRWDGKAWSIQQSFKKSVSVPDRFGSSQLMVLDGKLYSAGDGVFEMGPSGWQRVYGDRTTGFWSLGGTSSKNLFAVGSYGLVCHFNGTDWYRYPQLAIAGIDYAACWASENEVFILGVDGGGYRSLCMENRIEGR